MSGDVPAPERKGVAIAFVELAKHSAAADIVLSSLRSRLIGGAAHGFCGFMGNEGVARPDEEGCRSWQQDVSPRPRQR